MLLFHSLQRGAVAEPAIGPPHSVTLQPWNVVFRVAKGSWKGQHS